MQKAGEFDLIARYFKRAAPENMLGVGDDCALLSVSPGHELAVSTDMLLQGRHFLADVCPRSLGHKALAVNLSDLAAMGARPLACTLALSLPAVDHAWLQAFSDGFFALAETAGCPLVGGDTTSSPDGVLICVSVMGEVQRGHALRRDAALPGDDIWLSGCLGAPAVALALLQGRLGPDPDRLQAGRPRLELPQPRNGLGERLVGMAHAAIDVSDGLLQDLGHILAASNCAAGLWLDSIPQHPALDGLDQQWRTQAVLAGGDEYELCFTADPCQREKIRALGVQLQIQLSLIGKTGPGSGLDVLDAAGRKLEVSHKGFDHFSP